jgi:UDP-2,4-diacetamido-2,4,6-trideoxy-beta-L-altropyranose hydrolase
VKELRAAMAKKQLPVYVEPVSSADITDLFQWRNDVATRRQSLDTSLIDWENHKKWFESMMNDLSQCCLICKTPTLDQNVGVVRFDMRNQSANVSINLAPNLRGQGLGRPCLSVAIDRFSEMFEEICSLTATVRSSNEASLRLFRQIGFEEIKETHGLVSFCLRLNRVV